MKATKRPDGDHDGHRPLPNRSGAPMPGRNNHSSAPGEVLTSMEGLEAYWAYWQSAVKPPFEVGFIQALPVLFFDPENPASGCGAALKLPDGENLVALPLYKGESVRLPPQSSLDGKGNIPPNKGPFELSATGHWQGGENYHLGFSDGKWVRLDDNNEVSGVLDEKGQWRKLRTILFERTNEPYDDRSMVGFISINTRNYSGYSMKLGMHLEGAEEIYVPEDDVNYWGTANMGKTMLMLKASMPVGGENQNFLIHVGEKDKPIAVINRYPNGSAFSADIDYDDFVNSLHPGMYFRLTSMYYIYPDAGIRAWFGTDISNLNSLTAGDMFTVAHEQEIAETAKRIMENQPILNEIALLSGAIFGTYSEDMPNPIK